MNLTEMPQLAYKFLRQAGTILNTKQTRSLVLTGNTTDLFHLREEEKQGSYIQLVDFLTAKWSVPGKIVVYYSYMGPIRFAKEADKGKVANAWNSWRPAADILRIMQDKEYAKQVADDFDRKLNDAIGNPTFALEFLRQLCLCTKATTLDGKRCLDEDLLIVIDGVEMLVPEAEITRISEAERQRVTILRNWFSNPEFMNSRNLVVLLAESRSMINHLVARMPQMLEVEVPSPDEEARLHFIKWFDLVQPDGKKAKLWSSQEELAKFTAGLSIHALMQLLRGASNDERILSPEEVIEKVQDYIRSQLGDDVVEFKRPSHTLKAAVGFKRLKAFITGELIPRLKSSNPADALPGMIVCGPLGAGKSFIFEAAASESGMVVLILKNIRSMWFGQTDVIFERLKRVLYALSKVLLFIDEADTTFGGVGQDVHETERRLTGKVQAMMSDPKLVGKVAWLLMTARVYNLSPDIRRPGRCGDLIIPILDPEGNDLEEFIRWAVEPFLKEKLSNDELAKMQKATEGYSAASFSSLKRELSRKAMAGKLNFSQVTETVRDILAPPITKTRRYQTLQAMLNCTKRSLLPNPDVTEQERAKWEEEIRKLEYEGVK